MKNSTILILAAALAASPVAAGPVRAQTTQWITTTTTAPAPPSVSSTTVTARPPVNPGPAVVVSPPPAVSTSTETTESISAGTPAPAVNRERRRMLGPAENTNTTIVFKAADRRDIDSKSLRVWDDFAQAHPSIAKTLAYKPELINDPGYLRHHPDLNAFMQDHPDIQDAMINDPGNFAAIPPRPGE